MFPSSFDYVAARSVDEAVAAKREGGDDARFLAGGQSLIPMMKTRLATPAKLVDINGIPGLDTLERVERAPAGRRARAPRRRRCAPTSRSARSRSAAPWISDPLVRNRGTLCGSVAHCDPEGDWNSVLLATGADVIARGQQRRAGDPDHRVHRRLLHATRWPTTRWSPRCTSRSRPGRAGGSYQKLERKVGDYATVAVAAHLELGGRRHHRAGGPRAHRGEPGEHQGHRGGGDARRRSSRATSCSPPPASWRRRRREPRDDVRGSAEWKRNVVRVFTRRALTAAADEARAGTS